MNVKFLKKYAIVIDGQYLDSIRYLVELTDNQKTRERKRIAVDNFGTSYKDVQMVRVYE